MALLIIDHFIAANFSLASSHSTSHTEDRVDLARTCAAKQCQFIKRSVFCEFALRNLSQLDLVRGSNFD